MSVDYEYSDRVNTNRITPTLILEDMARSRKRTPEAVNASQDVHSRPQIATMNAEDADATEQKVSCREC